MPKTLNELKKSQKYLGTCDLGLEQFILSNKWNILSPKLQESKHLLSYKEFPINIHECSQIVFHNSSGSNILNHHHNWSNGPLSPNSCIHHKMQIHKVFVLKVNGASADFFKTRVTVKMFSYVYRGIKEHREITHFQKHFHHIFDF